MADDEFTANALADYIRRLFHVESGGDPNAVTGSNRGYGQFGPTEERKYGITAANRGDYGAQANAVAQEYAENNARLARVLGRAPTFADHYLTHQQGVAGGPALLSADPQTPAWQVIRPFYGSDRIAQKAITGNIPSDSPLRQLPVDQISAGGFRGLWQDRFNRGLTRVGLSGEAPPVSAEAQPISPGLSTTLQAYQAAPNASTASGAPASPLAPPTPVGGFASMQPQGLAALLSGQGASGGFLSQLGGLGGSGADKSGGGTLGGLGQSLISAAAKKTGLPFPNAKLKPFDENLRPLPLNLPNFAAMAQIPKFAGGGIVDRPTVAMVGEHGPEAIVPLTDQERMEKNPYERLQGYLETLAAAHTRTGATMAARSLAAPYVKGMHPFRWDLSEVPPGLDPAFSGIPVGSLKGMAPSRNIEYRGNRAPPLPEFAEGGIVDRPTMAMVGENGPEAIVPLRPTTMAEPDVIGNRIGAIPAVHNFMSDLLTVLKNKAARVATAPLDALTGRMQVSDPVTGMPTPEAMTRGSEVAGTMMTGAMPFAQRGSAGVFGGRLAQGANLSELEAAETFAEHGAHPDDIWKSTGWFQGADAKWRHEIPDTSAKFNSSPPASGKLPDLLTEHPLLYAAYPQLKDANFKIVPGEGAAYLGKIKDAHTFEFGENALNRDPSAVLHEIQHAVQGEEGFAKGGMQERGPYKSPFEEDLRKLRDERYQIYKTKVLDLPPEMKARLRYINKVTETNFRLQDAYAQEAFQNYRRLVGETEARNVQERFRKTLSNYPQWSEDIPRSEQISSPFPVMTGPKAVGLPGRMAPLEGVPRGFDPFGLQR